MRVFFLLCQLGLVFLTVALLLGRFRPAAWQKIDRSVRLAAVFLVAGSAVLLLRHLLA
ncbi:hypothetical protein [Chitinilyticum piscinae]|uniref:hypothetical protein n=1 Tax=Chitinilyticum piscinae TaxID=2866724 RepID=UPI00187E2DCE|nr:hypothetical protein [Chitinilyticum piscinae]